MEAASSPFALFDDALSGSGDLLLDGCLGRRSCTDPAALPAFWTWLEAARRRGEWIALALRYELGYALEPRLAPLIPKNSELIRAWRFGRAEHLDPAESTDWLERRAATLDPTQRPAWVAGLAPAIERGHYLDAVARIQAWIDAGDCYQVNFTFPLHGELFGHPLRLYQRLCASQPVRYGSCLIDGDLALLSRSPELFLERRGDTLVSKPMKGTAARSAPPESLSGSEKNRAENLMIVDLIRNDLGRLVPPGGVRVPRLFEVEAYPSLWQMTSTVEAAPVRQALPEILAALFPCGSITGAPKIRAMERIAQLEGRPRGVYCGALGWLAPNGDFRFNVPIRTLEIHGRELTLGVGSGVVRDSVAAEEWEECLLKAAFLAQLEPGFELIETLRCTPDANPPYPDLELHLERLGASAAALGFAYSRPAAETALAAEAAGCTGPSRVRLALARDGTLQLTHAALQDSAQPVQVGIAAARVASGDPFLIHKTSARRLYDAELARATALGQFDRIFLNERGEVCEGARSNVFARIDGELLTPPLASGLLDGVLRRRLLRTGQAREARLNLADLQGAEALFVGNALRGLLRAELADAPPPDAVPIIS